MSRAQLPWVPGENPLQGDELSKHLMAQDFTIYWNYQSFINPIINSQYVCLAKRSFGSRIYFITEDVSSELSWNQILTHFFSVVEKGSLEISQFQVFTFVIATYPHSCDSHCAFYERLWVQFPCLPELQSLPIPVLLDEENSRAQIPAGMCCWLPDTTAQAAFPATLK